MSIGWSRPVVHRDLKPGMLMLKEGESCVR
jgi:hypothetical protein